jgi:NAD-dependent DNA ligase
MMSAWRRNFRQRARFYLPVTCPYCQTELVDTKCPNGECPREDVLAGKLKEIRRDLAERNAG